MRTRGAVLRRSPVDRPYPSTQPLRIEDLELRDPGPGELLIRVDAAGLCHSDLSVVDGNRIRPVPMLLGHEAAGTVLAVGTGVHGVATGDRVVLVYVPSCGTCRYCGSGRPALCPAAATANTRGELIRGGTRLRDRDGGQVLHHLGVSGFATHAVVDRNSAVLVDPGVPADVAAMLGCAMLTGFGAVTHTAGVRVGESVAVFGLGGVGQAVVMSAAAAGAWPVVAVDPVDDKQDLALELGASHACRPDDLAQVLAEVCPGGVDWAFEAVGSAAVVEAAYAATGRGGGTVAIGLPHPRTRVEFPTLGLVAENRSILGSYMGSAQPQADIPRMIALWRAGMLPVDRLASAVVPLEEINTALEALADASAVRQIIRPDGTGGDGAGSW